MPFPGGIHGAVSRESRVVGFGTSAFGPGSRYLMRWEATPGVRSGLNGSRAEERAQRMQPIGTRHDSLAVLSRSRPAIETKDGPSEDHLLEVISDIETRLSHIRASQAERSRLESEILERSSELAEREETLSEREISLLAEERALASKSEALDAEKDSLDRNRKELERKLRQLQERQAELERRARDTEHKAEDLDAERRELIELQSAIEAQSTDLEARESLVRAQSEAVDGERRALDSTRAQLELERAALQETARRQAEQAQALKELAADLARREAEYAERGQEFDRLKAQFESAQAELTNTQKVAKSSAEQAQAEQARAADLARRCRELEAEREKVRTELTKTKRELDTAAKVQASAAPILARPKSRGPAAIAVWIAVMASTALATSVGWAGATGTAGLIYGLTFAIMLFGTHAVARRVWEASWIPIAAFFGAAGLWFGDWVIALSTALQTWELPTWLTSELNAPQLPLALAVLTAGLVANAGLYMLTGSESVMGQVFFGTMLATFLVAMPNSSEGAVAAAAVLWMALAGASMARWATLMAARAAAVPIPPRNTGRRIL